MSQSCILCEGYHDRAFWKGLLGFLRCESLGGPGIIARDPQGKIVRGGEFAFRATRGGFIRIAPVQGRNKLLPLAKSRLNARMDEPLRHLVINSDSDLHADGTPAPRGELQFETILQMARSFDPNASKAAEHVISLDAGTCKIISFPWRSTDPPIPGVPNQQTLERLICSALAAVHKDRPAPLEAWLKSRPSPPPTNPKEHAFSYLAGWFAENGSYEAFCESLWNDRLIAAQLRGQLERQGVWTLIEEIAEIR